MSWDRGDYQRERQNYIAATQRREPMMLVSTLIFTATWLVLIGIAATLQRLAPGTTTFADAASVVWAQRQANR